MENCKYCQESVVIVPYDGKEAKLYATHLKHKHDQSVADVILNQALDKASLTVNPPLP